jgi:hypothetical protein
MTLGDFILYALFAICFLVGVGVGLFLGLAIRQ